MSTSKCRKPRSTKPTHLPDKIADSATKPLRAPPYRPHRRPNALLKLAEMRGNEREIDLSAISPRNCKVDTRDSLAATPNVMELRPLDIPEIGDAEAIVPGA